VQFVRLRIAGFKSFVDGTELTVEPGTTGIVGPNGCGKSNLVEALRWVMGETSARRMRGEDMDDVIFGGTAQRPARNVAEVVLVLDNRDRRAPALFNDTDEIEVSRRIERGAGSDYRVNGRSVRARDVQILFADAASGAGSAALVSQGRVGTIINARPAERRQLLEEAAGVSGLHTRRHEAELKLRAAEQNLVRLDDILRTMEGQLRGLRSQARQAVRYRTLSEQIRRFEAMVLLLRWDAALAEEAGARKAHAAAEAVVGTAMLEVAAATTAATEAAVRLPDLRRAEAEAAAALARLKVAGEQLDAEERRVAAARAEAERRRSDGRRDLEREGSLARDAASAIERLAAEAETLRLAQAGEAAEADALRETVATARDAVETTEREANRLTEAVAQGEARRGALQRAVQEDEARAGQLGRRVDDLGRDRARLDAEDAARPDPVAAATAVTAAEAALAAAKAEVEGAEAARLAADAAQMTARDALAKAEGERSRLRAEADGLRNLLKAGERGRAPPVLDRVSVAAGFETAFAAALGDDLTAPTDPTAPVHWAAMPGLDAVPAPPEGAEPLAPSVTAPAELARALALVGLVPDAATGRRLAAGLAPGQVLVTRAGDVWRWDGLTTRAGAPTQAAVRLTQANRLKAVEAALAAADAAAVEARATADRARIAASEASARDARTRDAVRRAFEALNGARDRHARLAQAAESSATRRAALDEAAGRVEADRAAAAGRLAEARAALAALPDAAGARHALAETRAALAERRTALAAAQSALERVAREAEARARRLAAIAQDEASWRTRADGAAGRVAELEARIAAADADIAAIAGRPAAIARERQELLGRIGVAERARRRAADALVEAETAAQAADRRLKAAEATLAEAREARARAEGTVARALQARDMMAERIGERLQVAPDALRTAAGLERDAAPDADAEARLERLVRERDGMGAVNLLAEQEAGELELQTRSLETEREDLIAAIGRLRQGIGQLNREARERLTAAFGTVDAHFRTLFERLFGGGTAHLKLVEGDDPLESGLEIYASPPGKKLQVLSLLSGGEQALTALALLFAVFMTNPAPVCVLDEVDAPLDEANVDRFCLLVDEIARAERTRFLVVTHHRMTMARMDRLYGVTMMERGVSQLVSVDLGGAVRMAAE
jgi:chromosome segregation protein